MQSSPYSTQSFRAFTRQYPYSQRALKKGVKTELSRRVIFLAPVLASQVAPVLLSPESNKLKLLAEVGVLFTLGMLTHQLPARVRPGKSWLPSDWKAYFRIGLGIAIVQKINKAMDWNPAPWLGALEAVTVINPLALGLSVKSLAQYAVMAPLVAAVVQGASYINEKITPELKKDLNIPELVTRLLISIGMGVLGIVFYPKVFKAIAEKGLLGKTVKDEALKGGAAATGTAMVTCARGCSPGSIICLSETAEMLGGFGTWVQSHNKNGTI